MPRSCTTLTLDDAKRMLQAGKAAAASIGIAYNIAVVDGGGNLLAFVRQDGALIGSIDLTIGKAVTARIFDKPQPGAPLFGIQETNSRQVVIFGGGLPGISDGVIICAVGASAGTRQQGMAVTAAAGTAISGQYGASTGEMTKTQ